MLQAAAAALAERDGGEQAHLVLLVEQPPEQGLERQAGIGELAGADRLADDADMLPFGMIEPRVQPLAPLLALGEVLEEDAAGDLAAIVDRDPDQARNLLGLDEIMLHRLGEAGAFERDDALIALLRERLIEGDREIGLAEQGR